MPDRHLIVHLSIEDQVSVLRSIAIRAWMDGRRQVHRPSLTVRKGQDRRPGETALIEAIRNGTIDKVLLWSIDRIGRSLVEIDRVPGDVPGSRRRALFSRAGPRYREFEWNVAVRSGQHDGAASSDSAVGTEYYVVRPPHALCLFGSAARRYARAKVEQAKRELANGRGVREAARWQAYPLHRSAD